MKKALIVFHGNLSDTSQIKKYIDKETLLIAADGGLSHFSKLGIIPHVILGDMDSASPESVVACEKKGAKIVRFPREKDQTDSQLAIEYAVAKHLHKIFIFGLLGDRVDHLSANIFYLSKISEKIKLTIVENKQTIYFLRDKIEIEGKIGDELSLIPLQNQVKNITTTGLQYQLNHENLDFGATRGVSNVFQKERVKISITGGLLMVVHRST